MNMFSIAKANADVTSRLTSAGFTVCCLCSSFGGRGGVSESPPLSESLEVLLRSEILRNDPGESE